MVKKTIGKLLWFIGFLWQLPQSLFALVFLAVLKIAGIAVVTQKDTRGTRLISLGPNYRLSSVSFGYWIFLSANCDEYTEPHERGHSVCSLILGPLYLLIIGMPSVASNIYNRISHRGSKWYYSLPWEAVADYFGGVVRR